MCIRDSGSTVDQQVAALLRGKDGAPTQTVATAESCTGGLLAARLTELPGASEYVKGGIVVYANDAKVTQAGVPPDLIKRHGAVSAQAASALAEVVGDSGLTFPESDAPGLAAAMQRLIAEPLSLIHI